MKDDDNVHWISAQTGCTTDDRQCAVFSLALTVTLYTSLQTWIELAGQLAYL